MDLEIAVARASRNGIAILQRLMDDDLSWSEIIAALGAALSAAIASVPPTSRNLLLETHIVVLRETMRECEARLQ